MSCQPSWASKAASMPASALYAYDRMIYAAGDVCSPYQFTHAADFMARIVIQNAIFRERKRSSSLVIPWCTYTSPEIAHVGLYEHQAKEKNIAIDTYTHRFHDVDRVITRR